eukprot:CAMPEP_0119102382 /NCGR_PEP_ID=MMETSP1180-20130426/1151_1 /TAXON_ID=3052 ORGANISM="Chlamydomonas cf sp, Strain CCMP681" /NCGR_SAMPLE_ID=MMETSP1180 /ASSEMBLY_ACC=CAM_ASM_000741 /LENGTH=220 /DNA_ID=CAMNT_0007086663 /DNA_START=220 /DNA_END=882 /DNA_ORIENTATION=+
MPNRQLQGRAPSSLHAGAGGPSHRPATQHVLLLKLNRLTKWSVSAAAALVLLWRHDGDAMWCILGSIVNVILGKVLKKVVNQPRPHQPHTGDLPDSGMPSSHASSLAYLSVYVLASVAAQGSSMHLAGAGALVLAATFMAWLRIACGDHTPSQVLVGFILGSSTAYGWQQWGLKVLPVVNSSTWLGNVLNMIAMAAVSGFALVTIKRSASKDMRKLLHGS